MNDYKDHLKLHPHAIPTVAESPHLQDALDKLKTAGIRHRQTSPYQIKAGTYSLYPAKGTIYRDGDPSKLELKGVNDFIALVKREIDSALEVRSRRIDP